jgi:D-serine deaminase-like pyridoxal phosphate-dependent protein
VSGRELISTDGAPRPAGAYSQAIRAGDLARRPMTLDDLETPVVTVDLDRADRNIAAMQRYCDEHRHALRPHVKTHKLPQLAHMQVQAGARGITCQKLGEAELMADAGLDDILISFPLVGRQKAERLAALADRIEVGVVGDSATVAEGLAAVLGPGGVEVGFFVDCDTGFGRTGVQSPQEAAQLARLVDTLPGLRFAGLLTYPTLPESGAWLRAAREEIERLGLRVERVSGGGTPTARRTHEIGEVNEIRVGTYVYGDRACIENGTVPLEDCALRVRATVVSRPTRERAILDAGSKTLTSDLAVGATGFGLVVEHPEATIYNLNEEHGYVDVSDCAAPPEVGDVVTIVPNHACGTVNMHDEMLVHRSGEQLETWPVAARGKVR